MPTLRELEAGGRREQVGVSIPSAPTITPVQTRAEKQANLMLEDIQKLTKGAAQITQATVEASEYADKVRANDTYSNYVAGMNQINKFYQDKVDGGQALTVQDYRDKKDWQNKYMGDMLANSITPEDETNLTFKEGFIKPATEMLVKQDAVDSNKMFARMQRDWENDTKLTSKSLGKNITPEAFQQTLEVGGQLNIRDNNEKFSMEVANAHNSSMVGDEAGALIPITGMKELASKHYPKILSYNSDTGEFSRGEGFEDVSDEAYKSMVQALKLQLRRNTASTEGVYSTYNYDKAKDKIETFTNKNLPIPDEDIAALIKEEKQLMSNTSFTSKQGGQNRTDAVKSYNDDLKVYNSQLEETNSYFKSNIVTDGTSFVQAADGNIEDGRYGHVISKEFFIKTAKQQSSQIETQLSSIAFTPEDTQSFKNQVQVTDGRIEGLYTNQQATGETPPLFKKFNDVEDNVAGTSFGINEAMLYARYRKIKAAKSAHKENISDKIMQVVENKNMDTPRKLVAINNMVASNTITNTARTGESDRIKSIDLSVSAHLEPWLGVNSVPPSGINRVFSKVYAGTAPEKISREIKTRDIYRVGKFGIGTEKDEYVGLILPDGTKESEVKNYFDKILTHYNKDSAVKVNEDDIDAEPVTYKGDIGYVLTVYQGSLEHKVVLNADTIKMGFAIPTEE